MKVDHDDFAAWLEHLFHRGEIFGWVLDVVPYIADKKSINRLFGQQRIVGISEDRNDVGHFQFADAAVDVQDHVVAHVHGVELFLWARQSVPDGK